MIARFKAVLGDRIAEVRASKVLTDSPARLVSPEGTPSQELQRVQRLLGQEVEIPPRILEINRRHPLIQNLARLAPVQANDALTDAAIEQLFENLLLLDGLHPNPAQMVPRIQSLLEAATKENK